MSTAADVVRAQLEHLGPWRAAVGIESLRELESELAAALGMMRSDEAAAYLSDCEAALQAARDRIEHLEVGLNVMEQSLFGAVETRTPDEIVERAIEVVAALQAARDERDKALGTPGSASTRWVNAQREHERLAAALQAAQEALRRIAENAEAWCCPEPDMGYLRALSVIAGCARAALGDTP